MPATLDLAALLPLAAAAGEAYPRPKPLMEPEALAAVSGEFAILDARPKRDYGAGHVPRAVSVPHAEWEQAFHEDEDRNPTGWGKRIAALGLTAEKPVVVY